MVFNYSMEFSVQWRTLFFGIATLPLLTSTTAWAQDDDWLDGEDEEETKREETVGGRSMGGGRGKRQRGRGHTGSRVGF